VPSELTPSHLRALIAAATPGPWDRPTDEGDHVALCMDNGDEHVCVANFRMANKRPHENAYLVYFLVNNAPALADALEAKELLEWFNSTQIDMGNDGWVVYADRLVFGDPRDMNENGWIAAKKGLIPALRAAKEASSG